VIVAILAIAGISLMLGTPANARVDIPGNGALLYFQNVQTAGWLHAHVNTGLLDDNAIASQWIVQNGRTVSGHYWVQIRDYNINDCAQYNPSNAALYLETCNSSNVNQFFTFLTPPGDPSNYTWIQAYEPGLGFYSTDDGATDHHIFEEIQGQGNYAVWAWQCNNC